MITENKATYADLIATVKSALSKADQVETVLQNMGQDGQRMRNTMQSKGL